MATHTDGRFSIYYRGKRSTGLITGIPLQIDRTILLYNLKKHGVAFLVFCLDLLIVLYLQFLVFQVLKLCNYWAVESMYWGEQAILAQTYM